MALMSPGVVARSFDNAAVSVTPGISFNLPLSSNQLSWGYSFGVSPASITVQLQASFDNTTFFTIDSSTAVAGDLRTVYTAAPYIRINISASSGGSGITATLLAKTAPIVAMPASGAQQIVVGSSDVTLLRENAGVLAQRSGAQSQKFEVYRTYTDDTNFERLLFGYVGTNAFMRGENGPLGGTVRPFVLSIVDNAGGGTIASMTLGGTGVQFATSGFANWLINMAGDLVANGIGAFGYATGAGGQVTQITSKATTVVLNTYTGLITLNNASLAADTTVAFTLTNAQIQANDMLLLSHVSGGTLGAYTFGYTCAAGSASISVHNCTPGALGEAIVIKFAIMRGAIA